MKNRLFLSLAIVPLALGTASCGWVSGDPVVEAETALAEGDLGAARVHLLAILKETPDDHQTRLRYADIMLELGDGIAAQAAVEQVPVVMRESGVGAALMSRAMLLQDKPDEALAWAEKADSSTALGQWVRIGALLALGQTEPAFALADDAVAAHPDDVRLLALRGEMALTERKVELANSLSARALEADGKDLNALMLAGRLDLLREDFEAAEQHYAQAVSANSSILGPRLSLAAVQADLGKLYEAAETLKVLRETAPNHPMGMFLDAKLAFVRGDLDTAHQIMQAGEGALRKVPAAQLLMGEIAHLRGSHEQSIAFLRPFLRDNPGHVQGATVMAQALLAVGETDKALSTIEIPASRAVAGPQMLALASRLSQQLGRDDPYAARLGKVSPPEDLSSRLAAADRAIGRSEWAEARDIYAGLRDEGLEANALVLNNGAIAELNTGNSSEAVQLARRAIALTPGDPFVMDTLGWVLLQSGGDKKEALAWLGKAKDAAPGNLEFRWHYAAALAANGRRAEAREIASGVREFADAAQRKHIDDLLSKI
ncbi:tetratricopeptide repeat protein [Pontixanthobacter sp. CEM42]|uniref:tetratricopeptide repeat protein n=1 Tax=Pontixanthobacter sp. CEM42 TaxID=2792077 RepID=UPI001ADF844B|nr:tetratricopeptide repeat protein [Pontixanthobacter sp. CEM42]